RLVEISQNILQRLAEADESTLARLSETQRLFRELEKIDPSAAEMSGAHANAVFVLEELARALQNYSERLGIDPEELARIEERVSLFETLKRKYGGTIAAAIEFGANAAARLKKIESRGEELERLAREIETARKAMLDTGAKLNKKRSAAAPKLAKDIRAHLA